jgi:hypothetical protein
LISPGGFQCAASLAQIHIVFGQPDSVKKSIGRLSWPRAHWTVGPHARTKANA